MIPHESGSLLVVFGQEGSEDEALHLERLGGAQDAIPGEGCILKIESQPFVREGVEFVSVSAPDGSRWLVRSAALLKHTRSAS